MDIVLFIKLIKYMIGRIKRWIKKLVCIILWLKLFFLEEFFNMVVFVFIMLIRWFYRFLIFNYIYLFLLFSMNFFYNYVMKRVYLCYFVVVIIILCWLIIIILWKMWCYIYGNDVNDSLDLLINIVNYC